ncbi:MAG: hypothetical protein RLZZ93_1444 [Actinomycetota bacterium]
MPSCELQSASRVMVTLLRLAGLTGLVKRTGWESAHSSPSQFSGLIVTPVSIETLSVSILMAARGTSEKSEMEIVGDGWSVRNTPDPARLSMPNSFCT